MAEELVPIQENEYKELLLQTVAVIERARINVARRIATTASNTYWEIGRLLHEKKLESKHGSGVVKRLSVDLRERYPDMGLSPRQLWNMKSFYVRYKDCDEKLLRSVALLPWSQNLLLLNKDLSDVDTLYYAQESIATSSPLCQPCSRSMPTRCSTAPITSDSLVLPNPSWNSSWRTGSLRRSSCSCWNWARASHSSATSTP